MAFSQGTIGAMEEAHELFSQAEVSSAKQLLESTIEGSRDHEDDVFDACCMRAAIAVMEGEAPSASLRAIPSSTGKTAAQNYLDGVSFLARGSLGSAKLKFEELLRADESFGLAHLGLGAIAFSQKSYSTGFACFRKTMECLGSSAPALTRVGLALCAYHLNDTGLASRCIGRALEVNPDDVLAKLVQVVLLVESRQIRKLVETVGDLRRIAPGNSTVIQRVADLAYFKAVTQGAVKERAPSLRTLSLSVLPIANESQAAYARYQAGRLCHATGDYEEAKSLLKQAVAVLPSLVAASIHLAKVHLKLGERQEALKLVKFLDASFAPEREVVEVLLVMETEEGHHEMAMEYARRLAEMAPADSSTWRLCAWAHRLDKPGAVKLLEQCSDIIEKRGDAVPWQLRADLASITPESPPSTLEALIQERTEASGAHSPALAALKFNLALKLEPIDADRAMRCYIDLVRAYPTFSAPYFRLHHLATEKRCYSQALKWMALLQLACPNDAMFSVCTADTLQKLGRESVAVSLLSSGGNRSQRNVHVAIALGSMYLWSAQQTSRKALRFLQHAKNKFEFALALDPANLLGAHGLASCAGALSLATEAQLALERIRELPPNDSYVVGNMSAHIANVLVTCDSFRAACASLEVIPDKTPGQYSALAFCYAGTRSFHRAIEVIESGLTVHGNLPSLLYNAALVYCAGVMYELLPQNCTFLTEEAAGVLRGWLTNGLRHAQSFIQMTLPSWFESGEAAKTFVCHVARYTYSLKERMYRLQKAGTVEKFRSVRDAEGWKRKFKERQEEIDEHKRQIDAQTLEAELQLADTYAAIQERQLHITQGQDMYAPQQMDIPFEEDMTEGEKRDRDDEVIEAHRDDLGRAAGALAVGGMFMDDPDV